MFLVQMSLQTCPDRIYFTIHTYAILLKQGIMHVPSTFINIIVCLIIIILWLCVPIELSNSQQYRWRSKG